MVDGLEREYLGEVDFVVYGSLYSDPAGSEFARQHGVSAIPTMVLVREDGTEYDRWVGVQSAASLRAAIEDSFSD